jgi:hypothetical protein
LSITNPALAGLANRSYANSFTNVPNTKLPTEIQESLGVLYYALTGEQLDLSSNTLAVSAKDGQLQRLYVPKLYAKPDFASCFIRWGSDEITLEVVDGKLRPVTSVKGYKVGIKFSQFNPSGRGEDPAVEIKVTPPKSDDGEQVVYVCSLALAAADWKNYDSAQYETTLESDPAEFYKLLSAEGASSSGADVSGDVYDDRTFRSALFGPDQPQTYELEFKVTAVKPVKTSYGVSYILQAQPTDNLDLIALFPGTARPFGMWSPRFVKQQLGAVPTPVVSSDKPATLVMPISKPVYLKFSSQETQEGALDLNFD